MPPEQLRDKVRGFPDLPGVYLIRDASGNVIYVGKAASLRRRVPSYFADMSRASPRLQSLQSRISDIDYLVTDNEVEALILENSLIKENNPRFNVNLKDDKDYPYLIITPELYPRIELARLSQRGSRQVRYTAEPGQQEKRFGPFTDVGAVRETMHFIGELFPLRRCRQRLDGTPGRERPCLNYQMKRCPAPCRGAAAVPVENYRSAVRQVEQFLSGRVAALEKELQQEMRQAAQQERFEEAALLRDRLRSLQRVAGQQQKMLLDEKSPARDIAALVSYGRSSAVHLFMIRSGKLLARKHFKLSAAEDLSPAELMSSFIKRYYSRADEIPRELILSVIPVESELIARWLCEKAGSAVKLRLPQRGALKKLLDLAETNGHLRLKEDADLAGARIELPLRRLAELAGLPAPPHRVEAYDISHLQGDCPVGAMVVYIDGEAESNHYRRFNLQNSAPGDDYGALTEVLARRAGRGDWPRPDFVLIDGGKGQLNAARAALSGTELQKVPLGALAKNPDHFFIEGSGLPLPLAAADPLLQMLQRMRDEVHRFALGGLRARRRQGQVRSTLEAIPGVGAVRRSALLRHFGEPEKIRTASAEELAGVPGISRGLAETIYSYFQEG